MNRDLEFIWHALADKYKRQGVIGISGNARDLAIGAGVVGIYSLALAAGSVAGLLVLAPIVVAEVVGEMAEFRE